jgi:hypothetical protein
MEKIKIHCREAASDYIRRGWAPIPIRPGQKAPLHKEWTKISPRPADIPKSFSDHDNIGILLGHPSGGLVDIDLDSSEAILLAPLFLPKTAAIFGRPSRPRSHWLYVSETELANSKFLYTDGKVLAEIRSTGLQTVFPPSHHSGEEVIWFSDGEPEHVDSVALYTAVATLASIVVIARYWPNRGSRQDASLALAGALFRIGWTDDRVAIFLRSVAEVAGDEETLKRMAAAHYTRQRITHGQSTTGWVRLKALVGAEAIQRIRLWLTPELRQKHRNAPAFDPPTSVSKCQKRAQQSTNAQILIELAGEAVLSHTSEGSAYASFPTNGHTETWPLDSKAFRGWLSRKFYEKFQKPPGRDAIRDTSEFLEARALYESQEDAVFVRVGQHGESVYLDLGNSQWRVVEITKAGWRIVSNPPIRFRRANGILPLPNPESGGSLELLRTLINARDENSWTLIAGWMVGSLRPSGPYLVLALQGEAGSAKSTTAKMLRALIDPSSSMVRSSPANVTDLMIAARNSWVLNFDNMASVPPWLSDAICSIATGGGLSRRQLFTDNDEVIFEASRPVILNGIEDLAVREDLAERSVNILLRSIQAENRRTERELWNQFRTMHPQILGALLDAVSAALRDLDKVDLHGSPRMADAVEWITASEMGLSLSPGSFLQALGENQNDTVNTNLEMDPVASSIASLIEETNEWEGIASQLLALLNCRINEDTKRSRSWPGSPKAFAGRVRRAGTLLRKSGIEITFEREPATRRRLLIIRRMGQTTGPTVRERSDNLSNDFNTDRRDCGNRASTTLRPLIPSADTHNPNVVDIDDPGDDPGPTKFLPQAPTQ